jgi:hypothetical protein
MREGRRGRGRSNARRGEGRGKGGSSLLAVVGRGEQRIAMLGTWSECLGENEAGESDDQPPLAQVSQVLAEGLASLGRSLFPSSLRSLQPCLPKLRARRLRDRLPPPTPRLNRRLPAVPDSSSWCQWSPSSRIALDSAAPRCAARYSYQQLEDSPLLECLDPCEAIVAGRVYVCQL